MNKVQFNLSFISNVLTIVGFVISIVCFIITINGVNTLNKQRDEKWNSEFKQTIIEENERLYRIASNEGDNKTVLESDFFALENYIKISKKYMHYKQKKQYKSFVKPLMKKQKNQNYDGYTLINYNLKKMTYGEYRTILQICKIPL